jgi:succinate dehydrogenase/fumarate reductase cytochrome b subunit
MSRIFHRSSAIVISLFVILHLTNHVCALAGAEAHMDLMLTLRKWYRNQIAETILLSSVLIQTGSGAKLLLQGNNRIRNRFEKLQRWTGVYLLFFLLIHVSAVWTARIVLQLDSNLYFGIAGIHQFPFNLFFIPYYALGIWSVFGHLAAVHARKMQKTIMGVSPEQQAKGIMGIGVLVTILVFYALTNRFRGMNIPDEYLHLFNAF